MGERGRKTLYLSLVEKPLGHIEAYRVGGHLKLAQETVLRVFRQEALNVGQVIIEEHLVITCRPGFLKGRLLEARLVGRQGAAGQG